ncbi:alpha-L-glutamate ligase-like protein [Gilvimarinus sp. SDUM040013]|uniref:Alpha-L-glutamate ligase-like protein n=1 Tax=Gilvimarinus gilvus TaxID=3058038 RepID=A0ABU4RVF6_9GAMM|nr:alpha-L-glutamate ligase-like protein [Gilvimarinus sp. SDUM040013]MDO3387712.1 alpha-L-glutamate ligase-like protein [Gilvimarinus sp. SDUM040013]MDX6848847.1 alpha-L-glutamate ligase-like protein [Gilvimarinus sp. SDUM040013]
MLISPFKLRDLGMLGMNCRNRDFIGRYNRRELYPLVDNKLETKLLAQDYDVATPQLRFVVREQHEIVHIEQQLRDLKGFAIKPAKGSGGKGIWVITHRQDANFIKSSGAEITLNDIRRHMSNTLAGLYSLGGVSDEVIVEDLIEIDDCFEGYSFEGVPDIRIVVFRGFPVMAMLRLATHASDGKANLHQGAVGVGLDLATGRCLNAVQYGMPISEHPDTKQPLKEIKIPGWQGMLTLASRCYDMTGLGYIGADLVLDANRGPELLELNARPGLAIQVANGFGLLPRLRHVEKLSEKKFANADARVAYVMQNFAKFD